MKNFVILLSAGSGHRFETKLPKQYANLNSTVTSSYGDTILGLSIKQFINHDQIDAIFLMIRQEDEELVRLILNNMMLENNKSQLIHISYGGNQRYTSVINGLKAIEEFTLQNNINAKINVLIHDAARPFVSSEIISKVIKGLDDHEIVDLALIPVDTIKSKGRGDDYPIKVETLNRQMIYMAQTPQGFKFTKIKECCDNFNYELSLQNEIHDEVTICMKYFQNQIKLKIIEGDKMNFKITYKQDLDYAKYIFNEYFNPNKQNK